MLQGLPGINDGYVLKGLIGILIVIKAQLKGARRRWFVLTTNIAYFKMLCLFLAIERICVRTVPNSAKLLLSLLYISFVRVIMLITKIKYAVFCINYLYIVGRIVIWHT